MPKILKLNDGEAGIIAKPDGTVVIVGDDEESDTVSETYHLMMAFAAILENEKLYEEIFENLKEVETDLPDAPEIIFEVDYDLGGSDDFEAEPPLPEELN